MIQQREIEILLRETVESLDCIWWGYEFSSHHKNSFLRIYIDKPDGVTLEDCERVSRQVGAILDVNDVISGQYRLEISSPGIPRPLFYPEQYQAYIDDVVNLKLSQPMFGRRKVRGVIVRAEEHQVILNVDEQELSVPFSNILKASLATERGRA